jgi:hypothetical protein
MIFNNNCAVCLGKKETAHDVLEMLCCSMLPVDVADEKDAGRRAERLNIK